MRIAVLALAAAIGVSSAMAAPSLSAKTFQGLSEQELAALDQGKALIRQVPSPRSLSLGVSGPFADEIRERIRKLGANYIGEVIMVIPAGSSPSSSLGELARDLGNVEGYVGIPYLSKQNNTTYDLFDRMKIVESRTREGGKTIIADQHMEPFADYRASYSYDLAGGELHFQSENLSTISYKGFGAVAPGNMVWYLYGFSRDGVTALYGVGAVRTFDLMGLFSERLRTSFMGRIQAFFAYMYGKRR